MKSIHFIHYSRLGIHSCSKFSWIRQIESFGFRRQQNLICRSAVPARLFALKTLVCRGVYSLLLSVRPDAHIQDVSLFTLITKVV